MHNSAEQLQTEQESAGKCRKWQEIQDSAGHWRAGGQDSARLCTTMQDSAGQYKTVQDRAEMPQHYVNKKIGKGVKTEVIIREKKDRLIGEALSESVQSKKTQGSKGQSFSLSPPRRYLVFWNFVSAREKAWVLLEYQAMPSLRDVVHDRWLCTLCFITAARCLATPVRATNRYGTEKEGGTARPSNTLLQPAMRAAE